MERLPFWESELSDELGAGPRSGPTPIYKSYSTLLYRVQLGAIRRTQLATYDPVLTSQELLSQRVQGEVQSGDEEQALHVPQAPDEELAAHEPQSPKV